jgi:UDP-GlcNAc:undecaprenyl-phosphate/decaprenyl-phosphate GlcNAc-1-phosphate transferase
MVYIVIGLVLILAELTYFFIAARNNIIDNPNKRSSHSYKTIRGGGIIFPLAIILWSIFFDFQQIWAVSGLLLIATISFLDDLYTLSGQIRIFVHFLSVTFVFIQFSFFGYPWYYWIPVYIIFAGWINAFNFMDGINGITAFYSLVCLGTFWLLAEDISFIPVELLLILTFSVLIFSYFNARKIARTFAGDVGSVSMAFILAWIIFSLILHTRHFEYILLFSVYALDSIYTIIHRLLRKENIFKAHRSHLYQILSNELNLPHVTVSAIYAGFQLVINLVVIFLINMKLLSLPVFAVICILLSVFYLLIRYHATNRIKLI